MATSPQSEASFPTGLGWVAAIVVLTYAASQFFHWSAGWQVLILTCADVLAFVMFLIFTLRHT
jgi:low affinity Fe/Cu permease